MLRGPTMGETSGMVIRALSLGKPLVVSDAGWFQELPDSVAVKVPVDDFEVATLAATLELLAGDQRLPARMGGAAADSARRQHGRDRVADSYVAALEEVAGGEAVRNAVLGEVARAAHEVGISSDDPDLAEIGARSREVGIGDGDAGAKEQPAAVGIARQERLAGGSARARRAFVGGLRRPPRARLSNR